MVTKTFTVIYRVGGTARCEWRRVFTQYREWESAKTMADSLERMGYKALIHNTQQLNIIGMPEGWEA